MDFTGAIIIIFSITAIMVISMLVKRNYQLKKQKTNYDPYNDVHLGEMTHHDLPKCININKKKKWTAESKTRKEGGTRNEKGNKTKYQN